MSSELEALLAEFLERRERGEAIDAEELLRAHPARRAALLQALAGLERAEQKLDAVAEAGSSIGPYTIVGEIARGGMGRVLEAVDASEPGLRVALKLMDQAGGLGKRARERFEREASILAALVHPGVVRVLRVGLEGPVPWIAMERVQGESLAVQLARARSAGMEEGAASRPFTPAQVARIGAQLARAVEAVHAAGVLHRDIKPANVLLTPEGRVVLVDFGLVADESAATLTRTGDLLGTPQYMAPEQARGERADERTDVYGIAAVLHELLTMRAPHGSGDALELLERVRRRSIRSMRPSAPDLPPELERIVVRALAHRRSRRTPTAAALALDLEAFLGGRRVAARAPSAFELLEDLVRAHRSRAPLIAVAALVALGAWGLQRRAAEHFATRSAELVSAILGAWLLDEREPAALAAERLSQHAPHGPFVSILAGLARDEEVALVGSEVEVEVAHAWNSLHAGDPAGALAPLHRAEALAPRSAVPVVLLARAAERAGELELAAREYRAAVELLPGCAGVHSRLAAVHYARKDDAEAESSIRTAIAIAPNDGSHHFDLARILYRRDQHEQGLAEARLGADLKGEASSNSELQILSAGLNHAGLHSEARNVLQRVLARKPGDPRTLYNLGLSYTFDHHLVEACESYLSVPEGAQRSAARASAAWLRAGSNYESCEECRAYYEAHPELMDYDEAESLALEALRCNDSDEAVSMAALVARMIGRSEAIRSMLEELQANEKDDRRIGVLERALRSMSQ